MRLFRNISALIIISALAAVSQSGVFARAITSGYATDDTGLRPGMVVALEGASTKNGLPIVVRATNNNQDRIVGIATTIDESLVSVVSASADIYVGNEGNISAYVSNINGEVKKGDLLSLSPLNGILMRASDSSRVIALSQEDFNLAAAEQYPITNSDKKTVDIEQINVNLDLKGGNDRNTSQNNTLTRIGASLTGRQVSDLRVMVSLIVFFIVMLTEGAVLYGAISSAVKSLGRNPLAKVYINREMVRVVLIAVLVLLVGLAAVYALLWA